MKFLNKKEEVIDIELTQYGKYLLTSGKFKPCYYAFFDDDVLYDSRYAEVLNEPQNEIHNRIKDTPNLEPQGTFRGIETEISKLNSILVGGMFDSDGNVVNISKTTFQPTADKLLSLNAPIGLSSLDTQYKPAWSVEVLHGNMSSSVAYSSNSIINMPIPQLNLDKVLYKVKTTMQSPEEELSDSVVYVSDPFSDGSVVEVHEDFILLKVDEENTDELEKNYDIEVYESKTENVNGIDKELLIPLSFGKQQKELIKNGILLDPNEVEEIPINLTKENVEYYFDIFTDFNIDDSVFSKHKKGKNISKNKLINEKTIARSLYKSMDEDAKDC